ncbi:carbohydrate ABC transporter permease [Euzebya tangerina]|uniref:carbohydrate ABC transporter permease n=1 Tax=Euzebya tangerina TaxID=591198 RepID=UPI000E30FE96|nr:sugar ABC transporter permease [Euzebya tangerina]
MSETTVAEAPVSEDEEPTRRGVASTSDKIIGGILAVVAAFAVPALTYLLLNATFETLNNRVPDIVVGLVAILIGVVGVFLMYTVVDFGIKALPVGIGNIIQPYAWAGPAVIVLGVFLVYPAVNTVQLSFLDARGENFVGWDNYQYVFTDPAMLRSLRNTVIWIFVVPVAAVAIGLGFAVLADKLKRTESLAKSMIFLPMAISFVGAGIVWRFVYSFRVEGGGEQIGILNAIRVGLGSSPVDWLGVVPWNNLLLMVIMIWLQTGFAMVILSSAIKGVPEDMLEAARLDGATEIQIFWRIIVPSIMSSIVVVFTTMIIAVLKVFDIVWVMTGGQDGTEVIAERMIRNMFTFRDFGRGAAVAVFMFLAVIPVMIINVRRFREEESIR